MNKFICSGHLVKDVKQLGTIEKPVVKFTLGVRKDEEESDFIQFVAFGKTADFLGGHAKKGDFVLVDGSVHNNNYEKDGQKVYGFSFVATRVELKSKQSSDGTPKELTPVENEDDLPF